MHIFTFVFAPLLLAANTATAATYQRDLAEELEPRVRELSRSWVCNYVNNSLRYVQVLDTNSDSVVVSARYDFRCGDSTTSDTIYLTFRNGSRTCAGYKLENTFCTLYGKRNGTP